MTIADLLSSIAADGTAVAADQAKLTADQATQTVDDSTFATALTAAGVDEFSVASADGNSTAVYTMAPGSTPPYSVKVIPTAQSIVLPQAAAPAAVAKALAKSRR